MDRICHEPIVSDLAAPMLASLTPARIGVGRAGTRPTTSQLLKFRADHAAACDAVNAPIPNVFPASIGCTLELHSQASTREDYLQNPALGRILVPADKDALSRNIPRCEVLVAVGDGLSAEAVLTQSPVLLPALFQALEREGIRDVAGPVFIHNARVGILNDLGEATAARAVILLIGERPGLSTASSISLYMGYEPRPGCSDAHRNVLSNIHVEGTLPAEAAAISASWLASMLRLGYSGVHFKP
jgi:ethanolamine ammonia-lyase small subunit